MNEMTSDATSASQQRQEPNCIKESRRLVPACKRCHALKVRCIPMDAKTQFGLCKRCDKSASTCEYDLSNARKRKLVPPLTNSKKLKLKAKEIEELKQKLVEQENIIKQLRGFSNAEEKEYADLLRPEKRLEKYAKEIDELKVILSSNDTELSNDFVKASEERAKLSEPYIDYKNYDIIKEGLLSVEQCQNIINTFITCVYPRYPFIQMPSDTSVEGMCVNDYLFFLIVIYVGITAIEASESIPVYVQLKLECLISRSLAVEILGVGNKNVQLLKSLLLYCIWYPSPELFHHRRYHLFTILCASMANDLGLTGRPYFFYSREDGIFQRTTISTDKKGVEIKSLVLVIYIVMGSISLFLRRRVLLQWGEQMSESCLLLEESSQREYQLVALYARLSYVLERIYSNVFSTSEHLSVLELSSAKNQMLIQEYQTQINSMKQRIYSTVESNSSDFHALMSYLYSAQAYLYEPGLQCLTKVKDDLTEEHERVIYNSLGHLCESCVLTLEHFLELSNGSINCNPLFHTSRIIYTSGMLLRIRHISLTIPVSARPAIFTQNSISIIRRLLKRIDETIKEYPRNHFLKKLRIVLGLFTQTCLNQWYNSYCELSNQISAKDQKFIDPKADELAKLKAKSQHDSFQHANESGGNKSKKMASGDRRTSLGIPLAPYGTIPEGQPTSSSSNLHNQEQHMKRTSVQFEGMPLSNFTTTDVASGFDGNDVEQQLFTFNDELWTELFFSGPNAFDLDLLNTEI